MSEPEPTRPAPMVTEDSAVFWDAAREGRLIAQRCCSCGALHHPPRAMCPDCHSVDLEARDLSGKGVLYSYSVLHYPQHPAFTYPVVAALVDLDEGVRILSNVVGVAPAEVTIGMEVEVRFEPTSGDGAVPVFTLRRVRS